MLFKSTHTTNDRNISYGVGNIEFGKAASTLKNISFLNHGPSRAIEEGVSLAKGVETAGVGKVPGRMHQLLSRGKDALSRHPVATGLGTAFAGDAISTAVATHLASRSAEKRIGRKLNNQTQYAAKLGKESWFERHPKTTIAGTYLGGTPLLGGVSAGIMRSHAVRRNKAKEPSTGKRIGAAFLTGPGYEVGRLIGRNYAMGGEAIRLKLGNFRSAITPSKRTLIASGLGLAGGALAEHERTKFVNRLNQKMLDKYAERLGGTLGRLEANDDAKQREGTGYSLPRNVEEIMHHALTQAALSYGAVGKAVAEIPAGGGRMKSMFRAGAVGLGVGLGARPLAKAFNRSRQRKQAMQSQFGAM